MFIRKVIDHHHKKKSKTSYPAQPELLHQKQAIKNGENAMFNQMFKFQRNEVRMVIKNNQPWFVAKDVCEVLGLSNPTRALGSLEDDELTLLIVRADTQNREMNCVNESGLYHLIFKSRKKVAKEFRKWVTSEVLPSIRKYGFFMSTKPKDTEKRQFIESFFPSCKYGITSDRTGCKKIIPVFPHFRSCKIAKANHSNHPDLFNNEADGSAGE